MRNDYSYQLRKFIYESLQITISGTAIPVYDMVPDTAKPPYILFDTISEAPSNDMDIYGASFEVTLQIIVDHMGNKGGRKFNDQILNEVTKALSTRHSRTVGSFWLVSAKFTGKNDFIELSTFKRVRTIVTFNYLIH